MKTTLGAALAAFILPLLATSAYAQNDIARNNYKVKAKASADLQTSVNDTTGIKVGTNDVIAALLNELGPAFNNVKASQCDIIAHYENDEDILDQVEYYLVRTRGSGVRFKVRLDPGFFDTSSGTTVFRRTFSANNTTVKADFTDANTLANFNFGDVTLLGHGLTNGNVTIKDVGTLAARLNQANAHFDGSISGDVDGDNLAGSLSIDFGSALSNDVFDALPLILFPI
ncbi:hypothetical protein [Luteolibacter soli]|uniref:Uncharacterized protein n=1 Tax=Luteolibacter soli TaxID=3135280 RepID=A0ABU9B3S1_9BACT